MSDDAQVVVAGHICLDVIPTFEARGGGLDTLLIPGKLVEVGSAVMSTGGAVSNTGLALHPLGIPTRLLGRVGDDLFGAAILDLLRRYDDALLDGMGIGQGESSSYRVVVSPPGVDRIFLHCPGTNDTFGPDDTDKNSLFGGGSVRVTGLVGQGGECHNIWRLGDRLSWVGIQEPPMDRG